MEQTFCSIFTPPRKTIMTRFTATPTQSIAQQIGAAFLNDGGSFTAADGTDLLALIAEQRPATDSREGTERYEFADESAILVNNGAWDFESEDTYFVMQCELA
jgi:hypothetical protein